MNVQINFYTDDSNFEEVEYHLQRIWQLKNNRPCKFNITSWSGYHFSECKDGKQQAESDGLRLKLGYDA